MSIIRNCNYGSSDAIMHALAACAPGGSWRLPDPPQALREAVADLESVLEEHVEHTYPEAVEACREAEDRVRREYASALAEVQS